MKPRIDGVRAPKWFGMLGLGWSFFGLLAFFFFFILSSSVNSLLSVFAHLASALENFLTHDEPIAGRGNPMTIGGFCRLNLTRAFVFFEGKVHRHAVRSLLVIPEFQGIAMASPCGISGRLPCSFSRQVAIGMHHEKLGCAFAREMIRFGVCCQLNF